MGQRIPKWDNLKCLLIILVVVGHCIETFIDNSWMFKRMWFMIYVIHMPLFVFVSGLFARRTIAKVDKVRKNICFYLKAYIIYKVLLMLVRLVCGGKVTFNLLEESSVPWYMLAMVFFLGITYLIRNVKPSYMIFISIVLACAIGYDSSIRDFLTLTRVINFYPFFLVGYYAKEDMKIFESSKIKKIMSVVILATFVSVCWVYISKLYNLRPMMTGRNPYSSFCDTEYGVLYRMAYYVIVSVLGLSIIYLLPNKIGAFSFLGKKTLPIYIWHGVVLNVLRQLSWEERLIENLPSIAWKIIVLMSSILIISISCIPKLEKLFLYLVDSKERYVEVKGFEPEQYVEIKGFELEQYTGNNKDINNKVETSESLTNIKGWN